MAIGQVRTTKGTGEVVTITLQDDLSWEVDDRDMAMILDELFSPVTSGSFAPPGLPELQEIAELFDGVLDYFWTSDIDEEDGEVVF